MEEKRLVSARDTALEVLMQVTKANAWSDGSLKHTIAKNGLDARDAALASRICYGVIQNRMYLDYYIDLWCTQHADHLEPVILNILRIGAYQILFMDKIPQHAAVNEAVEMTKRHKRPKAAGMVNAVLHKFTTHASHLPEIPQKDMVSYLSIKYSHPKWLVEKVLNLVGQEECEAFLGQNNEAVKTTIHVNTLATDIDQLYDELRIEGIEVEYHEWLDSCLLVSGTGNIEALKSFREGHFMVQDVAAHLVTDALDPNPTDKILDICAAPGGKSIASAIAMDDQGEIISCDIHPHKLSLIEKSAERLHVTSIKTCLADGRESHQNWIDCADGVIADVPCSGLGIIRKKPDIRYKNPKELKQLPQIQLAILKNAANYVKPGGKLIYSTCTILPEENEEVVKAFLASDNRFTLEPFALPMPLGKVDGMITLWPQKNDTDGFFISRLRRKA